MILVLEQPDRPLRGIADGIPEVIVRPGVDLASMKAVRSAVAEVRPKAVLLTGGLEDANACEEDPERAFLLNAEGAIHLAAAAREFDAAPIYVSTSAVFGDRGGAFGEEETPEPTTVLGSSKHKGESFLLRSAPGAIVLRVGHVFELGLALERRRLEGGVVASAAEEVSPIGAADVGRAASMLLGAGAAGVFHLAGTQVGEHALWVAVAKALGVDPSARIQRSHRRGGASLLPAKTERFGFAPEPWQQALSAAAAAAPFEDSAVAERADLAPGEARTGESPAVVEVTSGKVVLEVAGEEDRILSESKQAEVRTAHRIVAVDRSSISIRPLS